jgi:hypothetical protein
MKYIIHTGHRRFLLNQFTSFKRYQISDTGTDGMDWSCNTLI